MIDYMMCIIIKLENMQHTSNIANQHHLLKALKLQTNEQMNKTKHKYNMSNIHTHPSHYDILERQQLN